MKNKTLKKSAFTLVELMIVIFIIALLAAIVLPAVNRAQKQAELKAPLPGITDANMMPEPVTSEQHFGQNWIIAKSRTNAYQMVVYYPCAGMHILSYQRVELDQFFNPAAQGDMESMEVSATLTDSQGRRQETECFLLMPLVRGSKVILIGVDTDVMSYLNSELLKNMQKKLDALEAPAGSSNKK